MRFGRQAAKLAVVASTVAATALTVPSDAAVPGLWTTVDAVPGTAGLVNPLIATAPDGTDFVGWGGGGGVSGHNYVYAKVRLPGRLAWLDVPATIHGSYLGITSPVGTDSGDIWALVSSGAGTYVTAVTRLHTRTQRWTKPVTLFTDQPDYWHMAGQLALTADGTLVATSLATPKSPPAGDPVYRVAVAVKRPGQPWHSRFLTGASAFAVGADLAVNPAGDMVVSFIQGYHLADMTVRAATKPRGSDRWTVRTLSAVGDSQRAHAAMGPDGVAHVVWTSPANGPFTAVRSASRNARRSTAPWVGRDLATGIDADVEADVAAGRGGRATYVYRLRTTTTAVLWSRHFDGTALTPPAQLSPALEVSSLVQLLQRPDDKTLVLYHRFTPAITSVMLVAQEIDHGVPQPPAPLTGDEASFGDTNSEQAGVDAASQAFLLYTRGDYPATVFAWQGQAFGPVAMTGSHTGVELARPRVVGRLRPGSTATCASGYWVETRSLAYSWSRNGHAIRGADGKRYGVTRADSGARLGCRIVATNYFGSTTLTSRTRVVG